MKVTDFSFADCYKAANLTPSPEIVRLRQEAYEKLRYEVYNSRILDLTRLYFGLVTKESPSWFVDAFREHDPSFSMVENQREAAVLAECILANWIIEEDIVFAGLAVLTASFNGNRRSLLERSTLVSSAQENLQRISLTDRQTGVINVNEIKLPEKSKVSDLVEEFNESPNVATVGELIEEASAEGIEATKTLTNQVNSVLTGMSGKITQLEEESAMLWWFVGGWSRILERPFSDLKLPLAAAMAGIDLAMLTNKSPGPIAVQALFFRLLNTYRKGKMQKVSIQSAIDDFEPEHYEQLSLNPCLKEIPDFCPLLTGFRLAYDYENDDGWKPAFRKQVGFGAETEFDPVELAMQIYREVLLLSLFEE